MAASDFILEPYTAGGNWEEEDENEDEGTIRYTRNFLGIPVDVDKYIKFTSKSIDVQKEEVARIQAILTDSEKSEYELDYDGDYGYICVFFNPVSEEKLGFQLSYDDELKMSIAFSITAKTFDEDTFNQIACEYYKRIFVE